MDNFKLVEKLQHKTNISYEEAKNALEQTNWDILDAFIYLEEIGKVQKPSMSIFYTNEYKKNYNKSETANNKNKKNKYNNKKKGNTAGGIWETVCKLIDTGNNIFFDIKRENISLISMPFTLIVLLLILGFYVVIPLFIVSLFFDIEYSLSGNWRGISKVNKMLKML